MKKISFIIIIAIGILAGCENLKYNEVAIYDEEWLFENESQVNGLLGVVYGHVRHGLGDEYDDGINGAMLASATDESDFSSSLSTIHRYYNGAWSSINAFSHTWTNSYSGIYTANFVLEKLDKIFAALENYKHNPSTSNRPYEEMAKIFEIFPYQARFLRAYFHFELAKTYGDVPLVTRTLTNKEANELKRSPVQEVFKFVVDECDAVLEFLPITYTNLTGTHVGRINRPTVLALKARALLYAASPLYKPANAKEAWRKAAIASKELIDHAEGWGIKFGTYANIWASNNFFANPEVIWFRYAASTNRYAGFNFPAGHEGVTGANCPSQNLVDAYEYNNAAPAERRGRAFGAVNPTTIPADAYQNLDPRFGLTIAKNGDTWPTVDPYNRTPLQTFEGGLNGPPLINATTTGYYLKKYVNGSNRLISPTSSSHYAWVTFRLGEVYLNYAEAMFNCMDKNATVKGDGILTLSANDAINVLRRRADVNMPLFGDETNGAAWEERYMRERMVELAFEGHRFWDLRRWMRGDLYAGIKTIRVAQNGSVTRGSTIDRGAWQDKYYLFPIPFSEIRKAQSLTQNPGW